jgi:hypothetical protein
MRGLWMRGECCSMFSDLVLKDRANVRDVKIAMKSKIGDIPRSGGQGSEDFGLISLDDRCVRLGLQLWLL